VQFLLSRTPTSPPGRFATSTQLPFDKLQVLFTHRGMSVVMSLPFLVLLGFLGFLGFFGSRYSTSGDDGPPGDVHPSPPRLRATGYLNDRTKYTALPMLVR
jgi:hypothetical protein